MRSDSQVDTSPEGWVARFLAADDEGRLRIARMVLDDSATAARCFAANHQAHYSRVLNLLPTQEETWR